MLPLQTLRDKTEEVIQKLQIKNLDARPLVEKVLELDQQRKQIQVRNDQIKSEMNLLSKEIGKLFKEGKKEEANASREKTGKLKDEIRQLDEKLGQIAIELQETLVQLPNIPHASVPPGKGEDDNEEVRAAGKIPEIPGEALPHWELAKKYDLIDFELGVKLTGAGFPVYKGKGARLQRALISFFLDQGEKAGYKEILPPLVVNEDSGFGTGQLPDKEGQMYHLTADNFYLIPTAEVPVTNIYRDVILQESDLPVKNVAYSSCFRREAGSWGAHVRGLNRLHQFEKVEIVQITRPQDSYTALEEMVAHVESLVQQLGLPYRVLRLCGGDISFTSALTFDFEVYSAAQQRWLEVSSVSNFENFQANRLKCRYKDAETGKNQLAHTLNGSALALPRIVAALLENNQTPEGIRIPEVLQPYTGFDIIA